MWLPRAIRKYSQTADSHFLGASFSGSSWLPLALLLSQYFCGNQSDTRPRFRRMPFLAWVGEIQLPKRGRFAQTRIWVPHISPLRCGRYFRNPPIISFYLYIQTSIITP
jgi:hypothetical protein